LARLGKERGQAGFGKAWRGMARHGQARLGEAGNKADSTTRVRNNRKGQKMAKIEKTKATQVFVGIPTKIDRDALTEHYGVPSEGQELDKLEMANLLRLSVDGQRFGTVLAAWRKQLFREHNCLLVAADPGKLVVADPGSRVEWSANQVGRGRRAIGKAVVVAYQTDAGRLTGKSNETRQSIVALNDGKLRLAAAVMR